MAKIRTYSEMETFETFDERFEYLKLGGGLGRETFGFDRYLNQKFYKSREWRDVRNYVITRDNGCNLAVPGHDIYTGALVHHMNPILVKDLVDHAEWVLNPEYLIATEHNTHNAIHYGIDNPLPKVVMERTPHDTKLW